METGEVRLEGRKLADRYLLQEEIASGGMGAMWRARDEVLGRLVAVKVLHDRLARDEDVLERFRMEAVAAARLSHPNVVRVFDTGVDEGTVFIVMELVEGRTLADMLAEGPLPPAEAAATVRAVLQGLAHAHREGVIHRDVKPANILVDGSGLVKVTDFGIAKAAFAEEDLTTTGNLLGTARYLAPEQIEGGAIDARSDVYSAGIVLYEALTGRPPFQAETHIATATMRLTKDPAPPRSVRPGIPRELDAVTMRALAREPDARFQTAEEMSAALDRAVPESPRIPPPAARPEEPIRAPSSFFRSWMVIPLVLLLLAGVAVGGYVLLEGIGEEEGVATEQQREAEVLEIEDVSDYDPEGDNGEENPDEVSLAWEDRDRETGWETESYEQSNLSAKSGVGLVIDLGEEASISGLRIDTNLTGWTFELHAGDEEDGLEGEPAIATDGGDTELTAEDPTRIQLEEEESAQFLLIWITELAADDDGKYRAEIADLTVFGG